MYFKDGALNTRDSEIGKHVYAIPKKADILWIK